MCYEKNCYFCRHLCFTDVNNINDYFCTLTGTSYHKNGSKPDCENYIEDMEE